METGVDAQTENAIRIFLAAIATRYAIAGAILYGSRARGTHRPDSDADLAVLLSGDPEPRMTTALAMADVAYEVLLETGLNIAPLPVRLDEWEHPERFSNPELLANIAREGVSVWPPGLVALRHSAGLL